MPPTLHSASSSFLCRGGACPACFPLRPFVGQLIPAVLLHQSPACPDLVGVTNHQSRSFPFNFKLSTINLPLRQPPRIAPVPRPEYPLSFSWRPRMRIGAAGKSFIVGIVVATISCTSANAQQFDQKLYSEMRWRCIGPFRGGRTVAISGVPHQPDVFYMAAVNGGVWKTTDFGNTWNPIFDDQPTGSVGALAVASSDPNIFYAGSGEGLQRPDLATGDGMYKSTDAGKSWMHLGLRDAQQIPQIVVDQADPNRVFVAVLGHPYGPNEERGIFRSTDGGRSFQKVLYKNEFTGGIDVILDPSNAQTVYAALWQAQQGPWENAYFAGPASGFFKSTDGGTTWNELKSG